MILIRANISSLIEESIKKEIDAKQIDYMVKKYFVATEESIPKSYDAFNKVKLKTKNKYLRGINENEYYQNRYRIMIEDIKNTLLSDEIEVTSNVKISDNKLGYIGITDEHELSLIDSYNYFLIDKSGNLTTVINNEEDNEMKYINENEGIFNDLLEGEI